MIINMSELPKVNNPYEKTNTSSNIIKIIKENIFSNNHEEKRFYDINF